MLKITIPEEAFITIKILRTYGPRESDLYWGITMLAYGLDVPFATHWLDVGFIITKIQDAVFVETVFRDILLRRYDVKNNKFEFYFEDTLTVKIFDDIKIKRINSSIEHYLYGDLENSPICCTREDIND